MKTGSIPVPASTLSLHLLHFSNHPPKSAAGLFRHLFRVSRFGHGVLPGRCRLTGPRPLSWLTGEIRSVAASFAPGLP